MIINSENIKAYVMYTLALNDASEITLDNLEKIKEININRLNYNLKEAKFDPVDLSYLKGLEHCSFSGFLINDEIKEKLEKLNKLNYLEFDHCKISGNKIINNKLVKLYLNCSDFKLLKMFNNLSELRKLIIKGIIVDSKELCGLNGLEELQLLNCEVKNSGFLTELKGLRKIKIIGSTLDNESVIKSLKEIIYTIYSNEEFRYIK